MNFVGNWFPLFLKRFKTLNVWLNSIFDFSIALVFISEGVLLDHSPIQPYLILPVETWLTSIRLVTSLRFFKCIRMHVASARWSATVGRIFPITTGTVEHFYNRTRPNEWHSSSSRHWRSWYILSIDVLIAQCWFDLESSVS